MVMVRLTTLISSQTTLTTVNTPTLMVTAFLTHMTLILLNQVQAAAMAKPKAVANPKTKDKAKAKDKDKAKDKAKDKDKAKAKDKDRAKDKDKDRKHKGGKESDAAEEKQKQREHGHGHGVAPTGTVAAAELAAEQELEQGPTEAELRRRAIIEADSD